MEKDTHVVDHGRIEILLAWLKNTPDQEAARLCADFGTSVGYLRQVAYGYKLAGLKATDIERITGGVVTRRHLRPNDWPRFWPELATATSDSGLSPNAPIMATPSASSDPAVDLDLPANVREAA